VLPQNKTHNNSFNRFDVVQMREGGVPLEFLSFQSKFCWWGRLRIESCASYNQEGWRHKKNERG